MSARETVAVEAPAYLVHMPAGMPDLVFDDYEDAFQHATGEATDDVDDDDEHPEEWRISLLDLGETTEVPVAHV